MQHTADYLTFGQWRYLRTIGQLQPLSASADPEVLTLEPRLHKLLNFFLDHKDLVVSREQILSGVWGEGCSERRRWPEARRAQASIGSPRRR